MTMRVKGYATHFDSRSPQDTEIELSPPTQEEISKLKEGDEVLVKMRFKDLHGSTGNPFAFFATFDGCIIHEDNYNIDIKNLVAILPQSQDGFLPETKKIEELEFDKLDIARVDPEKRKFVIDLQLALNTTREKLNEIIRHLNSAGKE